ncbi:D-alanine--D-alanine ligase [Aureitalea marina]|uniref:D-alanine--D-alanine ligase n=1 Tax=Aureitalea marina TaxID=930804 RepID=A0A2S7KQJ5_9FLAO|nr:D-alanine--D-alanine ligase [Aureitalea marina]PQB04877.1 D-alanine--D-alanine ligase A [Aureitalea marina]
MNKPKVAVAMGGYSSEKDISLQSGKVVSENLDSDQFDVYCVEIIQEGWFHIGPNNERYPIDKGNFGFDTPNGPVIPDVVFNTIHGTPGEDGLLASYWELIGIPQTSAPFYQAALSFNKRDTLAVLKQFGINTARSVLLNQGDEIDTSKIIDQVGLPCFVKPNRSGSSFGISKANSHEDLLPAIEKAFTEDDEIIIETALVGTEVSVGVYAQGGKPVALPVTEIVSENDFFDYEAKYLGKSDEITPARISDEETLMVQEEAKKIYRLLNMKGISRSEFIIQQGIPYFLEINTTPGLSSESIVPKQVRTAGQH